MNTKNKGLLILTVAAIFSITTLAFAGWGQGYGHMMGPGNWGQGWHSGYGYGQMGYYANLSAKESPDTGKASKLQGDVSPLQGNLDQKRLNDETETREFAPNSNRGFGGYGPMMGYGPNSNGYCNW